MARPTYDIYTDTHFPAEDETMSDNPPQSKAEARAEAKADTAPVSDEQAQADAAAAAEAAKTKRAEAGVTGSPNGDYAATAFASRIAEAQFEHRNQGHDATMQLIDDLYAAVQRLEAKLA